MLKLSNRVELLRKLQLDYLKKKIITSSVSLSSLCCALGEQPWWKARFSVLGQESTWGLKVKCWRVQRHSWHCLHCTASQWPTELRVHIFRAGFYLALVRSLSRCMGEHAPWLPLQTWEVTSSCSLCKLATTVNINPSHTSTAKPALSCYSSQQLLQHEMYFEREVYPTGHRR